MTSLRKKKGKLCFVETSGSTDTEVWGLNHPVLSPLISCPRSRLPGFRRSDGGKIVRLLGEVRLKHLPNFLTIFKWPEEKRQAHLSAVNPYCRLPKSHPHHCRGGMFWARCHRLRPQRSPETWHFLHGCSSTKGVRYSRSVGSCQRLLRNRCCVFRGQRYFLLLQYSKKVLQSFFSRL